MQSPRLPYIKPAVVQLEYTADVRVSMTAPCKGFDSGNGTGGQFGGCKDAFNSICQDVS